MSCLLSGSSFCNSVGIYSLFRMHLLLAFCYFSELADSTDTQCVCTAASELWSDIKCFSTSDENFVSENLNAVTCFLCNRRSQLTQGNFASFTTQDQQSIQHVLHVIWIQNQAAGVR